MTDNREFYNSPFFDEKYTYVDLDLEMEVAGLTSDDYSFELYIESISPGMQAILGDQATLEASDYHYLMDQFEEAIKIGKGTDTAYTITIGVKIKGSDETKVYGRSWFGLEPDLTELKGMSFEDLKSFHTPVQGGTYISNPTEHFHGVGSSSVEAPQQSDTGSFSLPQQSATGAIEPPQQSDTDLFEGESETAYNWDSSDFHYNIDTHSADMYDAGNSFLVDRMQQNAIDIISVSQDTGALTLDWTLFNNESTLDIDPEYDIIDLGEIDTKIIQNKSNPADAIVITGLTQNHNCQTLYRNDEGVFTDLPNTGNEGQFYSSMIWDEENTYINKSTLNKISDLPENSVTFNVQYISQSDIGYLENNIGTEFKGFYDLMGAFEKLSKKQEDMANPVYAVVKAKDNSNPNSHFSIYSVSKLGGKNLD